MTLSELFVAIGDDNLRLQILGACFDGTQSAPTKRKKYSSIRFGTTEDFTSIINGNSVGFIVFADKEKVDAARLSAPRTASERLSTNPETKSPELTEEAK